MQTSEKTKKQHFSELIQISSLWIAEELSLLESVLSKTQDTKIKKKLCMTDDIFDLMEERRPYKNKNNKS